MFCSWLHDTGASTAKSNQSVQTLENQTRKVAEINLPIGGVKPFNKNDGFGFPGENKTTHCAMIIQIRKQGDDLDHIEDSLDIYFEETLLHWWGKIISLPKKMLQPFNHSFRHQLPTTAKMVVSHHQSRPPPTTTDPISACRYARLVSSKARHIPLAWHCRLRSALRRSAIQRSGWVKHEWGTICPRDPGLTERQMMSKGCTITETKRQVFSFHETILSFGDWIFRDVSYAYI